MFYWLWIYCQSYGKSYYPSITITSLDSNKTQIYNSWKEKLGSITIPQVECVKCFIYSYTQGMAKPSTICNSIANAITFSSTDDSDDLQYLVDQPTNVDSLIPVPKIIWGYDCFKHEHYDSQGGQPLLKLFFKFLIRFMQKYHFLKGSGERKFF